MFRPVSDAASSYAGVLVSRVAPVTTRNVVVYYTRAVPGLVEIVGEIVAEITERGRVQFVV
jgi:hypothetical protein